MCGLVGIAGDTSYGKNKDMFTELLLVDSLRGMHSTGAAFVKRWQDEVKLVKKPGPSQLLITDGEYKAALAQASKVIIGHNRFATRGAHTVANAHPFAFPNVVGAHNGTLDSWSVKHLHHHEKFDTDSEAIFAHINEYGIEAAVKQMSGAWALTWWDKRDDTLNMLRNSQRPLFYTYNKDRSILMWASEIEMMDFVLQRNHLKIEDQAFFRVETDMHTKWQMPKNATDKFDSPTLTELKAPSVYVYEGKPKHNHWMHSMAGASNYIDDDDEDLYAEYGYGCAAYSGVDAKKTAEANAKVAAEDIKKVVSNFRYDAESKSGGSGVDGKDNNVIPFDPDPKKAGASNSRVDTKKFRTPYKNDKGQPVPKIAFNKIVANGCVFCSDSSIPWGEFIKILPVESAGTKLFLCEACYNDDEVSQCCTYLMEN